MITISIPNRMQLAVFTDENPGAERSTGNDAALPFIPPAP